MTRILLLNLLLLILYSCGSDDSKVNQKQLGPPMDEAMIRERMTNVNKHMSRSENDEINAYIERRNWKMTSTNSGVRYMIYSEGKGLPIKNGDMLKLKYTLDLISGVKCYDSENDGLLKLEIGKYEVSGLNEALKLIKKGDKAKVIVPSHLGYGLIGDQNRVPSKATLIYDIEILNQ